MRLTEFHQSCPHCGGPAFSDLILAEKKDACYHKVKASAKVWPSAYASGRLVQCRKKGAANYGNKSESVAEGADDKFSVADKVEELVRNYKLFDERGWTDLFSKLAGKKLYGQEYKAEIYRAMEYASKFLQLLDSIRMRSDYRGQQDPKKDQELIDLSNQWLDLFNKATSEYKAMSGQGVAEGQLNELDLFAPVTTFIKMTDGSYIQADWRKSQGNPGLSDSASFVNFKPVNPNVAKQLGLDSHQRNNSISNHRDGTIVPGGPIQGSGPLANRGYEVVDYNKPETMKELPPEIKSELIKWIQKQGVAEAQLDEKCWDTHKQVGMKNKGGRQVPDCRPKESVSEGAMPASVIRIKEKIRLMSDAEKKEYFRGKTQEQLQKMARSHGYGENSNVYTKYATEAVTEGAEQEILFYAKLPDGSRVYARVKDAEQLGNLQQQYRGAEIKTFDYNRPDILNWLQARGINLRKFTPGMVQTMYPGSRGHPGSTGLNEFAPGGSGDGGDDGFSDDTLKRLAAQWWQGDEDPRVEQTLMAAGWEIGQDEGYDDEPGVFVVQTGDINGNSYMSWSAEELKGLEESALSDLPRPGKRNQFRSLHKIRKQHGLDEQGVAEDAVDDFLAKGGKIETGKTHKPRKVERWQGSSHIGAAGGRGSKGTVSGQAANTNPKSNKPVVSAESLGNIKMNEKYNPEYDDEAGMADNNLQTLARAVEGIDDLIQTGDNLPEWCQEKIAVAKSMLVAVWDYMYSEEASDEVDPEIDAMFEAMDQLVHETAHAQQLSVDLVWESFESLPDHMLYETAAWRRKEGKSKKGGLNAKGVASYRRENPGSKLQMAVTTKPSKLKPGSKAAKRRKSFCARMSGVKGPMKKPNGKPTRKALALRKWNC